MPTRTTEHDALAGQLLSIMPRLMHTLKRDRQLREADQDLSSRLAGRRGQYHLLSALRDHGRMSLQQVAERLDVSPPTVSEMARSLTDEGLLARDRDPSDARIVWVSLTPKGVSLVDAERERWREVFLERFETLGADDQRRIEDAIPALERLLEADRRGCREEG